MKVKLHNTGEVIEVPETEGTDLLRMGFASKHQETKVTTSKKTSRKDSEDSGSNSSKTDSDNTINKEEE